MVCLLKVAVLIIFIITFFEVRIFLKAYSIVPIIHIHSNSSAHFWIQGRTKDLELKTILESALRTVFLDQADILIYKIAMKTRLTSFMAGGIKENSVYFI